MIVTRSVWFKIEVCTKCKVQLSDEDVMYRDGICPNCGNDSGNTMVKVKNIVIRKIYHNPHWLQKLLSLGAIGEKIEYEGKDETAKEWLKTNKI